MNSRFSRQQYIPVDARLSLVTQFMTFLGSNSPSMFRYSLATGNIVSLTPPNASWTSVSIEAERWALGVPRYCGADSK